MFWECVNEAKTENKELGMRAIEDFMAEKKSVGLEITIEILNLQSNTILVLTWN